MTPRTALQLGRVSNLPTVWTNVLVGALLAASGTPAPVLALLMGAMSLFYVGGMFLNDAFDRGFDARHRPERPIPAGQASAREVFGWGYGLMGLGLAGVVAASALAQGGPTAGAALAALALGLAIVVYDAHHKGNPLGPVVMGLCRLLVVVGAALAVAPALPAPVLMAALALLGHVIGLTTIAKQEHLDRLQAWWPLLALAVPVAYGGWLARGGGTPALIWSGYVALLVTSLLWLRRRRPGDVPRAVITLITGISVLDGLILAGHGLNVAAGLALFLFGLSCSLQRWVAGT